MTAKSIVIKGRGGKSGRCAGKAVTLTSGDLCCVLKVLGLRRAQAHPSAVQKSAKGEVGTRQAKLVRHSKSKDGANGYAEPQRLNPKA